MYRGDVPLYGPDGNRLISGEERALTSEDLAYAFTTGSNPNRTTKISSGNAFQLNAWVHACVSSIARIVASNPFRLTRNSKKTGLVTSGPEYELFRRPSSRKSRYELWYGTICMLELTGNAIWLMDMKTPSSKALPRSIRLLDSRFITSLYDKKTGELLGYQYRVPGTANTIIPLELSETIHFMYPNPFDPWWGLGPLQAAMTAVQTDYHVGKHNDDFFIRGAQLGGILINKRGITTEQLRQMREQFDSQYSGQSANHKTAILSGDWDYKPFMIGQREMEFMEQRRFVRETVGAVFGVPGIVINDPNNRNYATANAELRLFAENNWLPKIRYIEDVVDAQFFDRFSPAITGFFDTSDSPGLREDLAEKAKTAQIFFKMGATYNELVDKLDLPFRKQAWGNYWWVTKNDIPADADQAASTVKPAGTIAPPPAETDPKQESVKQKAGLIDSPARIDYWRLTVKRLSPIEKRLERKISRYLFETSKLLDAGLSEVFCNGTPTQKDVQGALSIGGDADARLLSYCHDILVDVFDLGYQDVLSDLGVHIHRDENLINKFRGRVDAITAINASISRKLEELAEDVIEYGYSADETREKFRRVMAIVANNSKEIARTEAYAVMNYGRLAAMQSYGIQKHEWLSARDEASRCHPPFIHAIDGEVANLGREFSNGLRFPCDSGGSLGESANTFKCRCMTIPVIDHYLPEGFDDEQD